VDTNRLGVSSFMECGCERILLTQHGETIARASVELSQGKLHHLWKLIVLGEERYSGTNDRATWQLHRIPSFSSGWFLMREKTVTDACARRYRFWSARHPETEREYWMFGIRPWSKEPAWKTCPIDEALPSYQSLCE